MRNRFALIFASLILLPAAAKAASETDRITAIARSHVTPAGLRWAQEEGGRVRRGEIESTQVEQDVASVPDGIVPGANPDELVLIALLDAQAPDKKLNQSIANVLNTLSDTQRPNYPRR